MGSRTLTLLDGHCVVRLLMTRLQQVMSPIGVFVIFESRPDT